MTSTWSGLLPHFFLSFPLNGYSCFIFHQKRRLEKYIKLLQKKKRWEDRRENGLPNTSTRLDFISRNSFAASSVEMQYHLSPGTSFHTQSFFTLKCLTSVRDNSLKLCVEYWVRGCEKDTYLEGMHEKVFRQIEVKKRTDGDPLCENCSAAFHLPFCFESKESRSVSDCLWDGLQLK